MLGTELDKLVVRIAGDNSDARAAVLQTVQAMKDLDAQTRKTDEALRQHEADLRRAQAVTQSMMTETEKYAQSHRELKGLLDKNLISQETYNRAMAEGASKMPLAIAVQEQYKRSLQEAARIKQQMAANQMALDDRMIRKELERQAVIKRTTEEAARASKAWLGELGSNLTSAGMQLTIFGGIFTGVMTGVVTNALMAAGQYEQTQMAFSVMMGSASQATATLKDLTRFAAETPFEMPEVGAAARGLTTFGERGQVLMRTMKDLGNAASATNTQFGMVALIYNQIRGVGKLLTQDFRQLSSRGILSLQDLADHFGVTLTAAQSMLSGGKITFNDVKEIFRSLSAEGGRFANMMEKQSQTLLGKWSTFKDQINITMRQIGETMTGGMTSILGVGIDMLDMLGNMSPEMKAALATTALLTVGFGGFVTVVGSAILLGGTLVTTFTSLSTAITAVTAALAAQKATAIALNAPLLSLVVSSTAAKTAMMGLTGIVGGAALLVWIASVRSGLAAIEASAKTATDKTTEMVDSRLKGIQNNKDPKRQQKELERATRMAQVNLVNAQKRVDEEKSRQENLSVPMAFYEWSADKVFGANPLTSLENDLEGAKLQMENVQKLKETLAKPPKSALTIDDIISKDTLSALDRFFGQTKNRSKQIWNYLSTQVEDQQRFKESIKDSTESLKMQVMTFGMSAEAAALYEMRVKGATAAELKEYAALGQQMSELRKAEKQRKEIEQLKKEGLQLKASLDPAEKLRQETEHIKELFNAEAISADEAKKALMQLEEQFHKDYTANFKATGVEGVLAGTAEASARLQEYLTGASYIKNPTINDAMKDIDKAKEKKAQENKGPDKNEVAMNSLTTAIRDLITVMSGQEITVIEYEPESLV